ncbi:hypothetical protein BGY98DRAFT_1190614 [Russula aff. rugulosa BPL654]|nr:hypothetical protein BGY98DRAFT_1190614 [Russula aff. rugulosa BPL654]
MSGINQYSQTSSWPNARSSATNEIQTPSHPLTTQQHGAFPPQHQPRGADTVNPTTHGQIQPSTQFSPTSPTHPKASHPHPTRNATSHDPNPIRGHQPPVVSSTVPRPIGDLERRSLASDQQQWALAGDGRSGRHFPPPSGGPPIYNNISSNGGRQTDAGPKRCRIPDCTYNAYYDVSEQEQTEYCGQGHQLQAVSTGLVASCVICKSRPRRTGERVCGRNCRDKECQAGQVQGSYYGVPVVRPDPRLGARPA